MTCDEWKKFIQVNIYGQTLQGLQQQGIALETMLSDIGCSKVWIVEGKMYNDDSCHQTTNSNEVSIVTPPVLSTTIADVKCPRFSTPAVSQVDLQRKFTLNLPIKFSEINSSYDEDFDCSHYSDDEINENNDIGELMNDIIQKVSESDKETAIEQTIFSSTINEMNVPRCSTPIIPHIDHHRTFTLNIPDTVSAIVLNEDGDIETDQSIDESATNNHVMKELSDFAGTQFEHNYELSPVKKVPTPRAGTKSLMTVTKSKKLILKRKSAASKLASTSVISRKQRVVLKESTSTDRMKNIRKILKKETSVIPTVENRTQSIQKEIPVSNIKRELSNGNTSQLYSKNVDNLFSVKRELSPIYVDVIDFESNSRPEDNETAVYHSLENSFEENRQQKNEYIQNDALVFDNQMYVGDDIMDYGGEEDTMILDHQEEVVTENLEAVDNQDDDEKEHEDENEHFSGDETAENRNACANKRVSFAEPLIQSSNRKKAEMNKVHIVKCHYDGCNKSYTWRMKYGKTRLVDHAFTHVSHLVLKCNLCEQTFQKIRSVRYHHKKSHPETKLEGCGIKRALDTSRDGTDFVQVWDKCYKNNISLCGAGDLNPFARQDKGIKKGNRVRSTRNSMNPELGSNVVEEEDENGEMVNNRCGTYIQVNIYGKTLQQLKKEGITLKSVLVRSRFYIFKMLSFFQNEIGCPQHWIGEVSIFTGEFNKESSLLSTTIANVKLPRCSTRVIPHIEPRTSFTLNMEQKISEIDEDDEMIDVDVEEVLSDLLNEVDVLKQTEKKAALPLLSTTIANSEFPRYSTPIPFEDDLGSNFTLNFSHDVSNIASDAEEELVSDYSLHFQESVKNNDSIVNVTSDSLSGRSKENDDHTLSLTTTKESTKRAPERCSTTPAKIYKREVEEFDAPKREIAALRTNSEPAVCPNFNDSLYQSGPLIIKLQNSEQENGDQPENYGNSESSLDKNTTEDREEAFYSIPRNEETGPLSYNVPVTASSLEIPGVALKMELNSFGFLNNNNDEMLASHDVIQNQNVYHELKPVGHLLSYSPVPLYNSYCDNEVNEGDSYHSIPKEREGEDDDETLQMNSEHTRTQYSPPLWPDKIRTKSILKAAGSNVDSKEKKVVSFKVPSSKIEKRRNSATSHTIVCSFEGCGKQNTGKFNTESFVSNCDFKCQTVGQMRYHYKKTHSDVKMTGFGIMDIQYEDIDIDDVWQKCFGKQIHIVGNISPKRFFRRKNIHKANDNEENGSYEALPTSQSSQ
ncbi:hypothetical protein CRE_28452 [Caenorhabditis remanei]|uniref:C2H2-type domain-containing protein n=1 Tax=Caenorhabditis remanei TaxID=31234 RepID=E3LMI4_CAERE|nr:hypothetical protein CRE_28452 [Caenorhabditis remanei]